MDRNHDEVISEMLIELHQLQLRGAAQDERNAKFDRRLDFTIKRLVKTENLLEKIEKRLEDSEERMKIFDQKLKKSIINQENFSRMQSKMNQYFLTLLNKKSNGKG